MIPETVEAEVETRLPPCSKFYGFGLSLGLTSKIDN